MKKSSLYLLIAYLFIGYHSTYASDVATPQLSNQEIYEIDATCTRYSTALKCGNIDEIKRHISGDMYRRSKTLLEENKQYGDFLRNFYQGAEFRTGDIEMADDGVIVSLIVLFPTGHESTNKLILRKDRLGTWRIVKEID